TVVVGAPSEAGSSDPVGGGAAYVFTRGSDGSWSQQGFLRASLPQESGFFGSSLAISTERIAIGAPGENSGTKGDSATETGTGAPSSGAVYVFSSSGTLWNQSGFLKAQDATANATFGAAVALDGGRLVVGAPAKDVMPGDTPIVGAGGAYVFQLDQQNRWREF